MTPKILQHLPKLPYCGLTIILSNPSRFDTRELLSGNSGAWFLEKLKSAAGGKILRFHCDIRTSNCRSPLLPGTRVVFCLGEIAQQEWFSNGHTLKEQRGSPFVNPVGVIFLSSFLPIDAHDFQPHEQRLNPQFRGSTDFDEDEDDGEAKGTKGATRRGNFKFWLEQDTIKSIRLLRTGVNRGAGCDVRLNTPASTLVSVLQEQQGSEIFLDIETTFQRTLTCIGFAFPNSPVYVFPIRRYNYTTLYSTAEFAKLWKALGYALRRNVCVTHNGAGFDWLVLAHHYRLPFGRSLYDTMISMNRLWPEAEKSLGHVMSLLTDEPYHKDEGVFNPHNAEQEEQLMRYNAKDVHALRLLKVAFDAECAKDAGLAASIAQGQAMIYPYMVAALRGIRCDEARLNTLVAVNDRYMNQLLRIAKILVGPDNYAALQGKSNAGLLTSGKQAARYFYDVMGYKCPRKTDSGEDSTDAKALLKLAIALAKQDTQNPLIPLRMKFAEVAKETSMLSNLNLWPEKAYL